MLSGRGTGDREWPSDLGGLRMDIVAVSHLRWDFVYQRPQHLMSRAARRHRVLYLEEPITGPRFALEERTVLPNLSVLTPMVPTDADASQVEAWLRDALAEHVGAWRRDRLAVWHYAVMAEPLTRPLDASVVVFDCMDELSLFRGAPPDLLAREEDLVRRADLVFTGGYSLWEAKRERHPAVHAFPSGVDHAHFARARTELPEPNVLRGIPRPRLMYAGVIDERIDLQLLRRLAAAQVGQVVLVGPVAKIDDADVPTGSNVHALGMQPYEDLPALFAHADVGLMPFALNDATRFISPTKTPEYLAAGLPVVSTAVRDVVRGYGELTAAVQIAETHAAFVEACDRALGQHLPMGDIDRHLAAMSWDTTWDAMESLIDEVAGTRKSA